MRRRLDPDSLRAMADLLDAHDRDEMAIPSYLHPNPALRWMAWRRIHVVARRLRQRLPPAGRVLDFGCGTGVLFGDVLDSGGTVVGVDLVLDAARWLVKRRGLDGVTLLDPAQARAELSPASVDLIVAAEVLEHLEQDLEPTLRWFDQVLKPGGELLVSLPTENAAYRFGRRLAGFSGDYHEHDAAGIDRQLQAQGWRVAWRRKVPLPGPLTIYVATAYTR